MRILRNWHQLLIAMCAILGTLQTAHAQLPEGGAPSGNPGTVAGFPFEDYDYFRIVPDGDSLQLTPVTRQELGLYTFSEHVGAIANLISLGGSAISGNIPDAAGRLGDAGQWLSGFTVTLGSQGGGGIAMVKKQDPTAPDKPVQVIVIVSSFNPWTPGQPNNSIPVGAAVCEKLKEAGICTGHIIMDVKWGQPDKTVDEIVKVTEEGNPDLDVKIIWIGLGMGRGFKLETVGENGQLPNVPDVGGTEQPPGSTNEPGGPATSGCGYDPDNVIDTLTSHGVPIVVSSDMDGFLCTSLCYKLHRMDETGQIDTGIFIHIPTVTDGTINDKFADGLLDVIRDLAEDLTGGEGDAVGTGGGASGGGSGNLP